MSFIYVASPYFSPSCLIRHERFHFVKWYMAQLFKERRAAYSPIMHWHQCSVDYDLPSDYEPWLEQDKAMLMSASHLHVLTLDGWQDSRGVQAEIRLWESTFFGNIVLIPQPRSSDVFFELERSARVSRR